MQSDFADYYSDHPAHHFAAKVWTNNAWVAALCAGRRRSSLGLPMVYLLFQNALNLALIGSIMIRHDRGGLFFGLILPHGTAGADRRLRRRRRRAAAVLVLGRPRAS